MLNSASDRSQCVSSRIRATLIFVLVSRGSRNSRRCMDSHHAVEIEEEHNQVETKLDERFLPQC